MINKAVSFLKKISKRNVVKATTLAPGDMYVTKNDIKLIISVERENGDINFYRILENGVITYRFWGKNDKFKQISRHEPPSDGGGVFCDHYNEPVHLPVFKLDC